MPCPRCLLRCPDLVLGLAFLLFSQALPAQVSQGSIIGSVHILRGNFPANPVMVSLVTRGALVNSIYADNEGRFGFNLLAANVYHVVIDEKEYQKLEETVVIDPTSPVRVLSLTLIPREAAGSGSSRSMSGGNPNLTDPAEYAKQVPKPALHEFEKGVKADQQGKAEDSIRHYRKAVELAPDFYAARNNLGSALLAKSQFPQAQEQFEKVVQVNPSDAAAYFNMANLYLLKSEYGPADEWVNRGLQKEPNSGFGNFLRGSLFARTGKPYEAEAALHRCLELDPLMSKAHLALVNLYLQQKRRDDAASELRVFLQHFPEDPFVPKAKQVLDKLTHGPVNP
jgi:tetratricopeptide (TPR) repeat protein